MEITRVHNFFMKFTYFVLDIHKQPSLHPHSLLPSPTWTDAKAHKIKIYCTHNYPKAITFCSPKSRKWYWLIWWKLNLIHYNSDFRLSYKGSSHICHYFVQCHYNLYHGSHPYSSFDTTGKCFELSTWTGLHYLASVVNALILQFHFTFIEIP